MLSLGRNWSGIRESNPRLDLGKVAYYHYTNPAHGKMCDVFIYSMGIGRGQDLGRGHSRAGTYFRASFLTA
jgi:hypothetical protein